MKILEKLAALIGVVKIIGLKRRDLKMEGVKTIGL
jgi:hypothetical protein